MSPPASVLLNRLVVSGKLRHLQILIKVAELGSLQRTASAIGMTQSSVTHSLAYLEGLLETQLFERHSRGVRPTPACQDLLPVAQLVMRGMASGVEAIHARKQRLGGVVRLAASVGAVNGLLAEVLPRFALEHPEITINLSDAEAEGGDQMLAIAQGEVDLVACRRPPVVAEGWQFFPLLNDRFVVLCRSDHPLAGNELVQWSDLESETWLLAPAGAPARERFDQLAAAFARPPRLYPVVTRSPVMLWSLLRRERLLAFLPLNYVRLLIDSGELRELCVKPESPLEPLGLVHPVAGSSGAALTLLEYLQALPGQKTLSTRGRPRAHR